MSNYTLPFETTQSNLWIKFKSLIYEKECVLFIFFKVCKQVFCLECFTNVTFLILSTYKP